MKTSASLFWVRFCIVLTMLIVLGTRLVEGQTVPQNDTVTNTTFTFNVEFESLTDQGDTTFAVKIAKERAVKIIDNQFTYGSKSRYVTFKLPDISDLKSEFDTIGMYTDTAVSVVIDNDKVKSYYNYMQSLVEVDSVPIVK